MRWVNLCPHKVDVITEQGNIKVIPATGVVARLVYHDEKIGNEGGIPIYKRNYQIVNLPDPIKGVGFIVSLLVAFEARKLGRTDIYVTGDKNRHPATGQPTNTDAICMI